MTKGTEIRLPTLNRLRAFDGVACTGAMTGAAGQLHLTQPAITRSIRALERELGTTLLERTHRGCFLTPEGGIFGRRTRRFLQQMESAVAETLGADVRGDVASRLARKISDPHVRSLVAILQAGNFRRAAKALGVAEPSLHRPARAIERLVAKPLYRRTPEGLGLSPVGADLARRFVLAAVEIKAGIEDLAIHHGRAQTSITLGVLALAPKRLLAIVAEKFLHGHPKAKLTILEGAYDELIVALRSGAIDLMYGALRLPAPFPDVDEEVLLDDPYCVVCRRDHPLARTRRPKRADLRNYDWVFPTRSLPRRAVLDRFIAQWKLSSRVQIETNSLGSITAALAASNRISILPREYALVEDKSGLLTVLDVRVPEFQRAVGLSARRDWLPTRHQLEFVSLLREAANGAANRPTTRARRRRAARN